MSELLCNPEPPTKVDPQNLTYRQLVDILLEAGRELIPFASVAHGPSSELDLNETLQKPVLWIEDECRIEYNLGQRTVSMGILALTQAREPIKEEIYSTENEISELSRMAQALDTLVAYLYKYHKFLFLGSGPRYDLLSYHRETSSRSVGWRMQIQFFLAYDIDCCLPELPDEYLG
jgi:hypothetical protein